MELDEVDQKIIEMYDSGKYLIDQISSACNGVSYAHIINVMYEVKCK